MAKVTFTKFFPAKAVVEGELVDIEVKRLILAEFLVFEQKYLEFSQPMPGAEVATAEQTMARRDEFVAWLRDSLSAYVVVCPDQIEDADGQSVTTGARLDELLAGQVETKVSLLNQVYAHNHFGEEVRKKLRSPSGSATTSDGQRPEAVGPKPEQIAADAVLPASAKTEGVAPAAELTASRSGETTAA